MRVLFLYLDAFSNVGGIQNFNKYFIKALEDIKSNSDLEFLAYSLYDNNYDERYVSSSNFCGFNSKKTIFTIRSIIQSLKSDLIILGHINLYPIGLLFKLFGKKIIVVGHGVDVWENVNSLKKKLLQYSDSVLAVSHFTKGKLIKQHSVAEHKIIIFPNTFDPYLKLPQKFEKPISLIRQHNIKQNEKIILTVSRLSAVDRYKGYDKVIEVMPELLKEIPVARYIIIGEGDDDEILRIKKLITDLSLSDKVIMTGYVTDKELSEYYMLADVFIMPSKKEGFGIVFLEAMIHGLPLIAGNKDGSVETLLNGELGLLVDPDDNDQIKEQLINVLTKNIPEEIFDSNYLRSRTLENYGFTTFRNNLENILKELT